MNRHILIATTMLVLAGCSGGASSVLSDNSGTGNPSSETVLASPVPATAGNGGTTDQNAAGTTTSNPGLTAKGAAKASTAGVLLASAKAVPAEAATSAKTIAGNADPLSRAVQIAWTVARAQQCGFYFYPDKVRSGYLAYEAQQGASPDRLQKIERAYDYSRLSVQKKIDQQTDYCTENVVGEVREDLPKLLAGDFNVPQRQIKRETPKKSSGGLFSFLSSTQPAEPAPLDRSKVFTPPGEMNN